ncbi:MAG TPA: hypothetical protein VGE37_03180, partial [Archangium sp.]
ERQDDVLLIPSMLQKYMTEPGAPVLPPDDAARVAFLRAQISWRKGRHDEALALLALVPAEHRDFLRAERLRAGVLSDPRMTSGPRPAEAIAILERVERHPNADTAVRAEMQLALARLHYAAGHFAEAKRRFSEAERVLARLEAEPESSTNWEKVTPAVAFERATSGEGLSPREKRVLLEYGRFQSSLRLLASFEAEIATILAVDGWKGTAHQQELLDYLHANAGVIREACGRSAQLRLINARQEHAGFRSAGRVVAIEVALARRDLDAAIERTERLEKELPSHPDVLFRLAALKQARAEALGGPAAEGARAEVLQLIKRLLEDASFSRREEAQRYLE